MTKFTVESVEKMGRNDLRAAAKSVGIKYGKLSLMQIREQLVNSKPAKAEKSKKDNGPARAGSKMLLAIEIMKKNPNQPRKVVIGKFIDEAKLTKAGASTYYQLCLKKLK